MQAIEDIVGLKSIVPERPGLWRRSVPPLEAVVRQVMMAGGALAADGRIKRRRNEFLEEPALCCGRAVSDFPQLPLLPGHGSVGELRGTGKPFRDCLATGRFARRALGSARRAPLGLAHSNRLLCAGPLFHCGGLRGSGRASYSAPAKRSRTESGCHPEVLCCHPCILILTDGSYGASTTRA